MASGSSDDAKLVLGRCMKLKSKCCPSRCRHSKPVPIEFICNLWMQDQLSDFVEHGIVTGLEH